MIVPNSTLANWQKEFARWCPSLKTLVFHGDKEKRALMKAQVISRCKGLVCFWRGRFFVFFCGMLLARHAFLAARA